MALSIHIWRTDAEADQATFEEMTHLLNNLIGPNAFYLEGEVVEG